jgi:hypothetical protein
MRVIFLDIDGVTVPMAFLQGLFAAGKEFDHEVNKDLQDPYKIDLLNQLKDIPGLHLVISSTWRKHSNMPGVFMEQDVQIPLHLDWRTTDDYPLHQTGHAPVPARGWQIEEWMSRHREVVGYAILDDDSDMLPSQKRHFVQTTLEAGLMPEHVTELRKVP